MFPLICHRGQKYIGQSIRFVNAVRLPIAAISVKSFSLRKSSNNDASYGNMLTLSCSWKKCRCGRAKMNRHALFCVSIFVITAPTQAGEVESPILKTDTDVRSRPHTCVSRLRALSVCLCFCFVCFFVFFYSPDAGLVDQRARRSDCLISLF